MSKQDPIPGTIQDIRPALGGMAYVTIEVAYRDIIPLRSLSQEGRGQWVKVILEETNGQSDAERSDGDD